MGKREEKTECNGIIGTILKKRGHSMTKSEFYKLFANGIRGNSIIENNSATDAQNDFFAPSLLDELKNIYTINRPSAREKAIKNIREIVLKIDSLEPMFSELYNKIKNGELRYLTKSSQSRKNLDAYYKKYNPLDLNKFIPELSEICELLKHSPDSRNSTAKCTNLLWKILYFAVNKEYPSNKYSDDLTEYHSKMMNTQGHFGAPSIRLIYSLAEKNNIVAKTELGFLLYYGFNTIKQNYDKSLEYFKDAAGVEPSNNEIGSVSPLACWNVAYMLFNYGFRREFSPYAKRVEIMDFENITIVGRHEKAIHMLEKAISNDNECYLAYNLLGVMYDSYDSILWAIENANDLEHVFPNKDCVNKLKELISDSQLLKDILKEKYISEEILFTKAAYEGRYLEAFHNLARYEAKKGMKSDSTFNYKRLISYLEEAENLVSPYASNKLGIIYETGSYKMIFEELHVANSTGFKEPFVYNLIISNYKRDDLSNTIVNRKSAYIHYKKALSHYYTNDSAWAGYNLLKSFKAEIKNENENYEKKCLEHIRNSASVEIKYKELKEEKF